MDNLKECREEFETWAKRTHTRPGTHFEQSHNGVYKDNRIAAKWAAWQAAWNRRAVPQANAEQDALRLDFMMNNCAWIQWIEFDHPQKRAQVWTQNEDEEYIILSGDDKSFATYREAIDAAIRAASKTTPSSGEGEA